MHRLSIVAFLPVFFTCLLTGNSPANSAPTCGPREAIVESLAQHYDEVPVAVGITHAGGLVEVLSRHDGLTWTIIVSTPDGRSCMVSSGEGWRPIEPVSTDPGA